MKFTIIIPTFNSEDYLAECLDSLVSQDIPLRDFEIILVDDCSTDQTVKIAKNYSLILPNFQVFQLGVNGGPGAARNVGIDSATGEWILFLDSDDELTPDCLSSLYQLIESSKNSKLSAIGYDWTRSISSNQSLNSSKRVGRRDGHFLSNRQLLIHQYLSHRIDGSVIFTAVRKQLLKDYKIYFAQGFHEDVDFIFRVYYHSQVTVYLDNILYIKRSHAASIINRISTLHISGYFRAWKAIGDFIGGIRGDSKLKKEYLVSYRYGLIGAIATRVREVARHCQEKEEIQKLLKLIFDYTQEFFIDEQIDLQLANGKTVYFSIVDLFLKLMRSAQHNREDNSWPIIEGVNGMSGKSWSCSDLHHSLFLRQDQVRTCCKRFFVNGQIRGDVVLFDVTRKPDASISSKKILEKKQELHQKINSGESSSCDGCPFLEFREWPELNALDIKYLSLEYHSVCNLKCSYCSEDYYGGKKANYDIKKTIDEFIDDGILKNCNLVVWGGGEPVIDDDFPYLLNKIAEKLPKSQQRVLTNSVKSSVALDSLLIKNKVQIITSIDAGTEEKFLMVRGRPGIKKVCDNIKRYADINNSRVTIKYIFTEGNSSFSEVRHFVDLMHNFDLLKCNFQISSDFKNENIADDVAIGIILMYGLLRKLGVAVLYLDELLRHRLGEIIDINDSMQIKKIHDLAGFDFIAIPSLLPRVVIWGAGQQAKYLLESSAFFKNVDVVFFVDSTHEKIGKKFYGKDILNPIVLQNSELPIVVAAVQGYPLVLEEFYKLNLSQSRLVRDLII
jgi:glycosyltransferase involved in cell wall biosynthesis/organic radical activating enzyme